LMPLIGRHPLRVSIAQCSRHLIHRRERILACTAIGHTSRQGAARRVSPEEFLPWGSPSAGS
jgi:hypothetical protein